MQTNNAGRCTVTAENPFGEVYVLGFTSSEPYQNAKEYSFVICTIFDKYFEKDCEYDLLSYLILWLNRNGMISPISVGKDRNEERIRIGKRIRDIRESKGMEAKELALRSGIDAANLCRIEQGKYSAGLDILCKLATALGCKFDIVEQA